MYRVWLIFRYESTLRFGVHHEQNGIDFVGSCYHISWSCCYFLLYLKDSLYVDWNLPMWVAFWCQVLSGSGKLAVGVVSETPDVRSLWSFSVSKPLTNFFFHHKFRNYHKLLLPCCTIFPVAPSPISRRAKTRPVSQWFRGFWKGILLPQVPTKVLQWWRISFKSALFQLPFAEFWQLKRQETSAKYQRIWVGRTKSGRSFPTIGQASP